MPETSRLSPDDVAPVLADLALERAQLHVLDSDSAKAPGHFLALLPPSSDIAASARELRVRCDALLAPDGWALLFAPGSPTEPDLARWRNALWPWLHVGSVYRPRGERTTRETLQGTTPLAGRVSRDGVLLAARRREHVLSPAATAAKFDQNAGGWNGEPGKPGYAHFRWMREYVALYGEARGARTILDFGCGAGWVGIEAALAAPNSELSAFDPSPAMVKSAESNARASGVARFEGRVGFGEAPPFEQRFDYVVSSGVVSFSPAHERWFDGLAATVKAGGTLVVGDLNPTSRGMQHRRATRPLLPARELNALSAADARAALERRGFAHLASAGYQRTRPIPQLAHWSDTRLGGALSPLLLAYNRRCAGSIDLERFDSWVMRLRAR